MTINFDTLSPMMRQYFQIKAERPDVLLLMRVGDFYEAYGEDAETLALAGVFPWRAFHIMHWNGMSPV
jgi:hypothetical protein